mgnify:CR=1 FL=1
MKNKHHNQKVKLTKLAKKKMIDAQEKSVVSLINEAEYIKCREKLGDDYVNNKINNNEDVKLYEKLAEQGDIGAKKTLGYYYLINKINEEEVVKWFKVLAEQGDIYTQKLLGYYYLYEKTNEEESVKWFEKSALLGDKYSQEILANIFSSFKRNIDGKGDIKIDKEKSFKWLKILSENGDINSSYYLSECYFKGYGTEQSTTKAVEILDNLLSKGNVPALYRLASYYFNNKKYHQALKYLIKINKYTESELIQKIGILNQPTMNYNIGNILNKEIYTIDVDKNIAECYLNGDAKLEKNTSKYWEYLEKSATKGNTYSQDKLVDHLLSQNTDITNRKAFDWLEIMCIPNLQRINQLALYKLAMCYFLGKGVDKDYKQAIKYFEDATKSKNNITTCLITDLGLLNPKILLGLCYFYGYGKEKNIICFIRGHRILHWYWNC